MPVYSYKPNNEKGLHSNIKHLSQFLNCRNAMGTYPVFIPSGGVNKSASSISTRSPNVGGAKTGFDVPQSSV